jgi:hypothetical protein
MGDAGVHRDDQIKATEQRGRLGEIGEAGSQVNDVG